MSYHQHVLSEATTVRLINGLVATGSATPLAVQPPSTAQADVNCSPEMALAAANPAAVPLANDTLTASMAALEISSARQRMLPPITRRPSQESVHSANENGNSCRICRWNRSDMEIIKCPCNCKGSVVSGSYPATPGKDIRFGESSSAFTKNLCRSRYGNISILDKPYK